MKPRLLDLFCGAGGAAMGYARAGFEVVGVDINPQPHYPFEFVRADATHFNMDWRYALDIGGFDAIHASPPCQSYSVATRGRDRHRYPDLYVPTREALQATGLPYVIENVPGAPYQSGFILCGSMFDMQIRRHRNFETSEFMFAPECRHRSQPQVLSITGNGYGGNTGVRNGMKPRDLAHAREVMGIDWPMSIAELSEAIPPAYTEWIGRHLLQAVERSAA